MARWRSVGCDIIYLLQNISPTQSNVQTEVRLFEACFLRSGTTTIQYRRFSSSARPLGVPPSNLRATS
eukprot:1371800-Amorphochlora_amoeboformis.AAC.1